MNNIIYPHQLSSADLQTKSNYILLLSAVLRNSPSINQEQLKILSFLVTTLQMPKSYNFNQYLQESVAEEFLEQILRSTLLLPAEDDIFKVFLLDISIILGVNRESHQLLNNITNYLISLRRYSYLKTFSELEHWQLLILGLPCDILATENIYPIKKVLSSQKKEYQYKLLSEVKTGEYVKTGKSIFTLQVIPDVSFEMPESHYITSRLDGIILPYQYPQFIKHESDGNYFKHFFLLGFIIPVPSFVKHYYPFLQNTSGSFNTEDFTKNMNFLSRQLRNKEGFIQHLNDLIR